MRRKTIEEQIVEIRKLLEEKYSFCECRNDNDECTHCFLLISINEIGAICDDVFKELECSLATEK